LSDILAFDPLSDAAPLAALHAASFADAWDAAAITNLLGTQGTFAFRHKDGFVLARAAGGEAEILTLAVAPAGRGRGLGRALLQAAIAQARAMGAETMFLEVGADNPQALALYAGLGFTKVGTRKGYYSAFSKGTDARAGGTDALVLRLPLPANFA
jgi:ribosomal-protein-alanine N-acetyltransferase